MDNTTIVCWNVRGLNAAARRDNVRTMMNGARAHIVCLVETKLNDVNQWTVASMLGANYRDFAYVPLSTPEGEFWSLPKLQTLSYNNLSSMLPLHREGRNPHK